MKHTLLAISLAVIPFITFCQEKDSIIGRPYKNFDATAFCSYSSFHPSQYLTDNNWDILCSFIEPGKATKLDSLGIPYNKSQLRLLEVGGLLTSAKGVYSTAMPIFSKSQTETIRRQSKAFADSIFPFIEPDLKKLISAFAKAGYSKQTYSLVFSYLLDSYIWDNDRLPAPSSGEDHGTWTGAYWAMYYAREHAKTGTNGFGPILQNWTGDLGYWLGTNKLVAFANEVVKSDGKRIDNQEVIEAVADWGLTDRKGKILIPVMHRGSNDNIDKLCKSITDNLSDAVKNYCTTWRTAYNLSSEKTAQIIFYHEVMWDLLDILESKRMISMPAILKGEQTGKQHFGDICFIVIASKE